MKINMNSKKMHIAILVVLSPILVPLTAAMLIFIGMDKLYRITANKLWDVFGPVKEPHEWYAWRPVAFSTWSERYGEGVWLERIWRMRGRDNTVYYGFSEEDVHNAAS